MTSHKEAPYFYSAVEIPREGFGQLAVDCAQCNGTVVHLDLAKVVSDPMWYPRSAYIQSYRHDLPFDGDEARIRSLISLVRRTRVLHPATVFSGKHNRNLVSYADGRHRIMLLFAAGYQSMPACVPHNDAEVVQRLIGCNEPDHRIVVVGPQVPR
jgi:hypothetical protein